MYTHLKKKKNTYTHCLAAHVRREDLAAGGRSPYQLSAWEPLCCSLTRVKTSAWTWCRESMCVCMCVCVCVWLCVCVCKGGERANLERQEEKQCVVNWQVQTARQTVNPGNRQLNGKIDVWLIPSETERQVKVWSVCVGVCVCVCVEGRGRMPSTPIGDI